MGETDQKPLISVIIPIYNVELYLKKCVDSVLEQTYRNLEIILVDDGSPDLCPQICDKYAENDHRVIVIHKSNGGLSDARNAGLKIFKGQYLMFVDSDDWLPVDAIDKLYNLAKKYNAQLVVGGYERVQTDSNVALEINFNSESVLTPKEAMRNAMRNGCAAWARLYERRIHQNVFFPKEEINEDEAIVLQILNLCSTIIQTNTCVYYYNTREDSITTSLFSATKLAWQNHCVQNLEWISRYYPDLTKDALYRLMSCIIWELREMALSEEKFDKEVEYAKTTLKRYYVDFMKLKLNKTERLRIMMNRFLPFSLYQIVEKKISLYKTKR